MKMLIIRHAQTTGQPPEAPLSELGEAQAEALVPVLLERGAGPLFSSPYRRAIAPIEPYAVKTAQIVKPLPALRERTLAPNRLPNFRDHIARSFEDSDYAVRGGESHRDLLKRWAEAFVAIAQAPGLPALVSHGGMISALFNQADPSFGFAGWEALRTPDLFEVTLAKGQITSFNRIDLEFST